MNQRRDNCQFLLHSMRIGCHRISERTRQCKLIPIPLNPLFSHRRFHLKNIPDKVQILNSCQMFVKIRIVRNVCHTLFASNRILFDVYPVNRDRSLLKLQHTCHRFDRGTFPGSVMSDESINISCLHKKIQIIHRLFSTFISF